MPRPSFSLPLLALLASLLPGGAWAAQFTVSDGRAAEELTETTRLYIDGTLAATFRLDGQVSALSKPLTVPDRNGSRSHDYALCGEITIRGRSGKTETHEVSGQGTLIDPDGRSFAAVGARDFTVFYLLDMDDPSQVEVHPGRSPFCQAPVS